MHKTKNVAEKIPQVNRSNKIGNKPDRTKLNSLTRVRHAGTTAKRITRYMESLSSSPSRLLTFELTRESSSLSEELPEPYSIRADKKSTLPSSQSNSYDDSEMDRWAANLPSEILEIDDKNSGPVLAAKSKRLNSDAESSKSVVLAPKGKRLSNEDAGDEVARRQSKRARRLAPSIVEPQIVPETPMHKVQMIEIPPTPHSQSPKNFKQVS